MACSSCLINRLAGIKAKADVCSVEQLHAVLEEAIDLADSAVTEIVSTELAIDHLLEPAPDADFWGDEGIK